MKNDNSFKTWTFKTVTDGNRKNRVISVLNDDAYSRYNYDSNMANCKQVKEGDIVLVVDKEIILGFAIIASIKISAGKKKITKCPVCKSRSIEIRKVKKPTYKCQHNHEFNVPLFEMESVTKYSALYEGSFIKAPGVFTVEKLRRFYRSYNQNLSIQELRSRFFEQHFTQIPQLLRSELQVTLDAGEALDETDDDSPGVDYIPNNTDERETVLKQIKARRGQKTFRDKLIKKYGAVCMVTGCTIMHIIEACHINPYKGEKDNDVNNGLLLRTDIHTLFDLNLVGIEPQTLTVHVKKPFLKNGYEDWHLKKLLHCTANKQPAGKALETRWAEFNK